MLKLFIGNRNYSAPSLAAALTPLHFGIPLEMELVPMVGDWQATVLVRTGGKTLPVLMADDLAVREPLNIAAYFAGRFADHAIFPASAELNNEARLIEGMLQSGVATLIAAAPMNLRASFPGRVAIDDVVDDLRRLEGVLGDPLTRWGGPFLYGAFTAADALAAPVVSLIRTYELPASDTIMRYVEAIYALPAFQAWLAEAIREPWILDDHELAAVAPSLNRGL